MGRKRRHVVIIDDAEIWLGAVMRLVGKHFLVTGSSNAYEGIDLVMKHPCDLLITGYLLRECTGLDVVDSVRAVYPDLPILVVSGGGWSWDLHIEAARRGAYCLSKCTPPERFQDMLIDFINAMLEFKKWKAGMCGKRRKAAPPLD